MCFRERIKKEKVAPVSDLSQRGLVLDCDTEMRYRGGKAKKEAPVSHLSETGLVLDCDTERRYQGGKAKKK